MAIHIKALRRIAIGLGLLAILALITSCAVSVSSSTALVDPPATSSPPSPPILTETPILPTATSLPSPTQTPSRTPTQTPTQTPTRVTSTATPTHTPLSSVTFTPTSLAPTSTTSPVERPNPIPPLGDAACACDIEHVVLISIDGLRPDALEQADTPVLDALRAAGAYSPVAQAVLPTVTLVNHASMLGGMSPEKHGIYWNVDDPALGKVNGPTLFSVAHEAGLSTAMVVGKPKLEHLVLPGSVDRYDYAGFTDRQVFNHVWEVLQTGLPDVLFIHLPDVDSAGHAMGWMSPLQLVAVSQTDSLIGELVAALEADDYLDRTLLIITSDHGGSGLKHGSDSPEDMTVPWLAVGPGVPAGITLESNIVTYDTAATVLHAFDLPIPATWDGQPVLEIFGEIPPD